MTETTGDYPDLDAVTADAVRQLQEKYPSFRGNADLEQFLQIAAATGAKTMADALLARGLIKSLP